MSRPLPGVLAASLLLDVAGNLPTESWTMDVELCADGEVAYSR